MLTAAKEILHNDGLLGFWRGIGPALILVINPVIQYTTFERLVAVVLAMRERTAVAPGKNTRVGRSALTDYDLFLLGAVSKLVATGSTYPYVRLRSVCEGVHAEEADCGQVASGQ